MKKNIFKSAAAAAALLLAGSPALDAQNLVFDTGNPIVNSAAFGGQIGHEQAGSFGSFGAGDRWIGIGNPTFMGGSLPVYGMRIQDSGQAATLSLNNSSRDLELQWGNQSGAKFRLNFITDPNNQGIRNILTARSSGFVGINQDNPSLGQLHVEGDDTNNGTGVYARGTGFGVEGSFNNSPNTISFFGSTFNTSKYAVYGDATTSHPASSFGVYGRAVSLQTSYGVYGNSTLPFNGGGVAYGVYGVAQGAGTNNNAPQAGYFSGNVTVTGTFTNGSDRKLKEEIQSEENVMDRILALKPSTYKFKQNEELEEMHLPGELQHGFIAQELEEVFPELVHERVQYLGQDKLNDALRSGDMTGVKEPVEYKYKSVNYISLIPVLTAGIQEQAAVIETQEQINAEQAAQIETQQAEIADLKARLDALEGRTGQAQTKVDGMLGEDFANVLYQNTPNPFNSQTRIRYELAEGTQAAEILVFDMNGRQLRAYTDLQAGDNSLVIEGSELEAGMYFYSLIVNGAEVATKRMILTK